MATKRLPQLDVLRAVAILLVLCHHVGDVPDNLFYSWLKPLHAAGWMGVDLFFVLSGFLVSGLVIKEYQQYKSFDAWRFFVRRGFKIYPAYYAFLILSLPAVYWVPNLVTWQSFLVEACFAQNSLTNIWGHTWSLAVEEQFYILLCLGFYILSRRAQPLKWLPGICLFCMILSLVARWTCYMWLDPARMHAFFVKPMITGTPLRLDALAFGMLLSCIYHMHGQQLELFVRRHRIWLLLIGVALIAPCFIGGYKTFFLYVFGLTTLYLGFGSIMLVTIFCMKESRKGLLGFLAGIGFYSYSIYLWHKPLTAIFPLPWFAFIPQDVKPPLFIVASITLGILMAKAIEMPALKLREKLYPSRGAHIQLPEDETTAETATEER